MRQLRQPGPARESTRATYRFRVVQARLEDSLDSSSIALFGGQVVQASPLGLELRLQFSNLGSRDVIVLSTISQPGSVISPDWKDREREREIVCHTRWRVRLPLLAFALNPDRAARSASFTRGPCSLNDGNLVSVLEKGMRQERTMHTRNHPSTPPSPSHPATWPTLSQGSHSLP